MSVFKFSPIRSRSRSNIPLSKMHTTTGDFFRWDVALATPLVPGDVVNLNLKSFVDGAPNPFPINGSMNVGLYAFFVPNRIVWSDWKFYIEDLKQNLTIPYFTVGDLVDVFADTSIPWHSDWMESAKYLSNIDGLGSIIKSFIFNTPYASSSDVPADWRNFKLSALPLRMANRIWWDWMRDKMHISDAAESSFNTTTGGHISLTELAQLCAPRYRCYKKNFFTTCFDTPQDGAGSSVLGTLPSSSENAGFADGGTLGNIQYNRPVGTDGVVGKAGSTSLANNVISSTSINDLRLSNSKQQLAERMLLAGKTVLSRALALFGTTPTIEELQMSNYLGGHEEELLFKTSSASVSTKRSEGLAIPAGSFGYHPDTTNICGQKYQNITCNSDGIQLNNIKYKTDESGYLFVFCCITPNVQYFQGLPRNWTRGLSTFNSDVNDFFHSDFENQPLQPVLANEICVNPNIPPKNIYAFNLMYSDYKYMQDSLAGDFLANWAVNLMNNMHLGRDIYDLLESVNSNNPAAALTPANIIQSSIYDEKIFDRKFTISQSEYDHFIVNHKITLNMSRPMQMECLPSLDSSLSQVSPKDKIETGGFRL